MSNLHLCLLLFVIVIEYRCDAFALVPRLPHTYATKIVSAGVSKATDPTATTALYNTSLLSAETISRLQQDYNDLRDAFNVQAKYFETLATDPDEISEDSIELTAYLTHLQRFQQELAEQEATEKHDEALTTLKHVQDEFDKLHDMKLMQDFELELAQTYEKTTKSQQERAMRLAKLLQRERFAGCSRGTTPC